MRPAICCGICGAADGRRTRAESPTNHGAHGAYSPGSYADAKPRRESAMIPNPALALMAIVSALRGAADG